MIYLHSLQFALGPTDATVATWDEKGFKMETRTLSGDLAMLCSAASVSLKRKAVYFPFHAWSRTQSGL